ncbi:activated Cdc42 kinase-like isoform X1 [Octopus bimaculoides]|uniref:activated Cdc42 kinase-like isoform X1 n=1 Tax=Octopus bimaculoides TaxID=37653 RepID=UPI00071E4797|nr:activated Cdc42 kinase-like isoform X1 [Octopus bimaculoides]XP_052828193.1 activated Cdc42 kinase-like isoform X1 [Octopus bimaculoides]XP_052828194.1 activated Cdc42 kinase-like isoform X1 [Octopus bimaculoides]XP_052828195.1 activated Cdc42 kinase-like isoform X1 [Octopus bimaculoides]XP_052828196.1 activated Cdc42 kinase-like isoform X1 [Octopus bimaculoides]|eukprot:XP_014791375.1 PREDICTED: tyrosine-protein kinase PR2-like isoform X2 [Octopus bimaculoides]
MAALNKELYGFLIDAELEHYYSALKNELKISSLAHLKYVRDEDLINVGMTKPEMRRFKKYYKKEIPQGTIGKIKKNLSSGISNTMTAILRASDASMGRSLSPSPPEQRMPRPVSYIRPLGKQIIPPESISCNKTLGEGEFGIVQQGIWTTENNDKVQVAIKCLSRDRMQNGVAEFLKEANIMQTIDHENIVRMFGVVLDKESSLMLVTELAPMRSLLECLKEPSLRLDFPVLRLCDFSQQICDGMAYLESKRLIHRDLAARNILVFSKNKVKISDFGLSRALGVGKDYYQSNFTINLKLPIAWCAPECINYLKFTSASDVWSYGVTLWEMFTYGFQPWAGMTGQQILEAVDQPNCQRLDRPDLCPREYFDLMKSCWEDDPKDRPTFSEIFLKQPKMRPSLAKAVADSPETSAGDEYLVFKAYDTIVILDKNPENAPSKFWKGALDTGKCGLFDATKTVAFIEPKTSPIELPRTSLSRKESSRRSGRKLRADMISGPKDDLRHTGHIGYDGAVFGDIPFIGDGKLPVKVASPGKLTEESRGASISLPRFARESPAHDRIIRNSQSDISLNQDGSRPGTNGYGNTWSSRDSLESSSTIRTEGSGGGYQDIDEEMDFDFGDFKVPDLTTSLDFGPSLMDEVMKALEDKKDEDITRSLSTSKDTSPVVEETKVAPVETTADEEEESTTLSPKDTSPLIPPHVPETPPREPKSEGKKQAKVKPMSAHDEKMINNAIALANEFAMQCNKMNMDDDQLSPKSETSSDSPKLIQKLKISMKRSPKQERKKTFTEEIALKADLDEDLPPESQEAYNILVMKGAGKESSPSSPAVESLSQELTINTELSPNKAEPESSSFSSTATLPTATITRKDSDIKPLSKSRAAMSKIEPPPIPKPRPEHRVEPTPRIESITKPEITKPELPPKPDIVPQIDQPKEAPPLPETPPRTDHLSRSEPKFDYPNRTDSSIRSESQSKPEILPKTDLPKMESKIEHPLKSEHPSRIPHPSKIPPPTKIEYSFRKESPPRLERSESQQRSEPLPRMDVPPPPPPTAIPKAEPVVERAHSVDRENGHHTLSLDSFSFSKESSPASSSERSVEDRDMETESRDKLGGGYDRRSDSHSERFGISSPKMSFDEEFAEPSPREIMSKLARESRIRRSMDHQRAMSTESMDHSHIRNLREPQGIPTKVVPTANGEDEEVDTNPLRMLRGGAIPIRGGRGQGKLLFHRNKISPWKKNSEEIEALRKLFCNEVSEVDCRQALEETKWNIQSAIKYIKLKQLISTGLADVNRCKEALLKCNWDVEQAADHLLVHPKDSPECVDV